MAPPGVFSTVLLCVAVAAVSGAGSPGGVHCGVPGCLFAGGCRQPHRVTCDLRGVTRNSQVVEISERTFPPSLQTLTMSHVKSLRFHTSALRSLPNLKHIQLLSINSIVLEDDSMSLNKSTHVNVTLDHVHRLTVAPRTFSGWGRPGCSITMRNIERCSIAAGAFPTAAPIPTVALENIASLSLAPGAFTANITTLSFSNVTLARCRSGTFSGRLQNLSLFSVTLRRAERGCLRADGWRVLLITSSHLDFIRTDSFSGDVSDVLLQDNFVRRLDAGGIRLNVTRFTARACRFGELRPEALRVTASRSVSLQNCTVDTLRRDAFRQLRIDGDNGEGVRIQRLRVDRADPGALRFADSTVADDAEGADNDADAVGGSGGGGGAVILSGLVFGTPCACGVRTRARRLLFRNDEERPHHFPDGDNPLLQSVLAAHCVDTENKSTATLAEFEQRRCGGPTPTSAHQDGAWPGMQYATVAAPPLVLILLLLTSAVLMWLRRRTLPRHWYTVNKDPDCPAISDDVWVVPSTQSSVQGTAVTIRRSAQGTAAAAPDTAVTGAAICLCRVPPPQRHVTSEPLWTYVRESSETSLDGIYDVPRSPAALCGDRAAVWGDNCATEQPEPGTEVDSAAAVDARVRVLCPESDYDVVRGPPVAICSYRWPASEPVSRSESEYDEVRGPPAAVCSCR